jgi:hypothetical protein
MAAYERQMEWKKRSVKSSSSSSSTNEDDLTFQPTLFTSKDTNTKYKVQPKTKELTIHAGSVHVERYEKARLAKAEAEKKLYGTGKGKPVQTTRPGYSMKMAKVQGRSNNGGHTSVDESAGNSTSTENTTTEDTPSRSESHDEEKTESTTKNVDVDTQSATHDEGIIKESSSKGDGTRQPIDRAKEKFEIDDDNIDMPEMDMTLKDMEEHLSIVQVLERERREWHAERAKLTHCIQLQQIELAARSSAAQETAALIAKEFARAIETFEERLEKVETRNEKELTEIKELLLRADKK